MKNSGVRPLSGFFYFSPSFFGSPLFPKKRIAKAIREIKKAVGKFIKKILSREQFLITDNEIYLRGAPLPEFCSKKKFIREVA